MRKRTRIVLWSFAVLAGLASLAATAFFLARTTIPTPAERMVGSWTGEGAEKTRLDVGIAGGEAGLPLSLRISIKATFRRDGTLEWSQLAEGNGFRLTIEVPDPKKPGDIGRWEVLRAEGETWVVRIIGPGGPEYTVSFRGPDEFTMTPVDPAAGTATVLFRRVTPT